jgi:hypothetical protein
MSDRGSWYELRWQLTELVPLVSNLAVPLAYVVVFVIWSAVLRPANNDPEAASPEGTWTKIAGSRAAAATP